MQNICNRTVLIGKVTTNRFTRGQYYKAVTLNGILCFVDDKGQDYRLDGDKASRYFHIPESVEERDAHLYDLGIKRARDPHCTCGSWSVDKGIHSDWCDA